MIMPLETAKSTGFFNFGTGIMIGLSAALAMRATMPRATEMVGLMMQKMGFEIGDMLLALWDPEATYQQNLAFAGSTAKMPVLKKKRTSPVATLAKVARREPVLALPRLRNNARSNGKLAKLSAARRTAKARSAAKLN